MAKITVETLQTELRDARNPDEIRDLGLLLRHATARPVTESSDYSDGVKAAQSRQKMRRHRANKGKVKSRTESARGGKALAVGDRVIMNRDPNEVVLEVLELEEVVPGHVRARTTSHPAFGADQSPWTGVRQLQRA